MLGQHGVSSPVSAHAWWQGLGQIPTLVRHFKRPDCRHRYSGLWRARGAKSALTDGCYFSHSIATAEHFDSLHSQGSGESNAPSDIDRLKPMRPECVAISHPYFVGVTLVDISLDNLTREEINAAPRGFKELCRLTSIEEAVKLCDRFGGIRIVMPTSEKCDGGREHYYYMRRELLNLLCLESYERLVAASGDKPRSFPSLGLLRKARRNRLIQQEVEQANAGAHPSRHLLDSIVIKYRVGGRQLARILKRMELKP